RAHKEMFVSFCPAALWESLVGRRTHGSPHSVGDSVGCAWSDHLPGSMLRALIKRRARPIHSTARPGWARFPVPVPDRSVSSSGRIVGGGRAPRRRTAALVGLPAGVPPGA